MGRRQGGVRRHGEGYQFDFVFQGRRYRPTLTIPRTPANDSKAETLLVQLQEKIKHGVFKLADYFPQYKKTAVTNTVKDIGKAYLATLNGEKAYSTIKSYTKILDGFWFPLIGDEEIAKVTYGRLKAIIAETKWGSNKTRNNKVSVLCQLFEFAYLDEKIETNPADRLGSLKVQKSPPEPYDLEEALALIEKTRVLYGDEAADFTVFFFFEGLRPSEQIALTWEQVDTRKMQIKIDRARVMAKDKKETKTYVERTFDLTPRGAAVMRRQEARTRLAGGAVFHVSGKPYHDDQVQLKRWKAIHKATGIRYRVPYTTRHTSVTWMLMAEFNFLEVAEKHGHSPSVMLKTYAKWMRRQAVPELQREYGISVTAQSQIKMAL